MIEPPKKVARPERPMTAAHETKARSLYGESADIYGINKGGKRDGALMSSKADWKNT